MNTSAEDSNVLSGELNISSLENSSSNSPHHNRDKDIPMERCPLCRKLQKAFFCVLCVRNGNFIHSKDKTCLELFNERQLRYIQLDQKRRQLVEEIEKRLKQREPLGIAKQQEIREKKTKIALMRESLAAQRENIEKAQSEIKSVKDNNRKLSRRVAEYPVRLQRNQTKLENWKKSLERKERRLEETREKATKAFAPRFKQFADIFDVQEVTSEPRVPLEGMALELAEAQRTQYLRGRWECCVPPEGVRYSIVGCSLPANGDYSEYLRSLEFGQDSCMLEADNIAAALMYTAQLVGLLAADLYVRLPHYVPFSDFCSDQLSEADFVSRVARLNANVVHLCVTQNIDPRRVRPAETLRNILHLFHPSHTFNVFDSYEMSSDLAASLEGILSDSMRHSTSEDDDYLEGRALTGQPDEEWETVTSNLPLDEGVIPRTFSTYNSSALSRQMSNQSSTIFSSAANFWRLWK